MNTVNTEDIVLGEPRNAQNPLLSKPPLGRPLTRCYTTPFNREQTFGQSYNFIDGGVPAALNHFNISIVKPFTRNGFEKDFVTLNKQSTTAGCVRAQEHRAYREANPILRAKGNQTKVIKYTKKMSPDCMTFGVPTRPSTPVFDLLENRYQDRWIIAMREVELAEEQEAAARKFVSCKNVHDTRTSLLRKQLRDGPEQPALWHMSRWSKTGPVLDSGRSMGTRYNRERGAAL